MTVTQHQSKQREQRYRGADSVRELGLTTRIPDTYSFRGRADSFTGAGSHDWCSERAHTRTEQGSRQGDPAAITTERAKIQVSRRCMSWGHKGVWKRGQRGQRSRAGRVTAQRSQQREQPSRRADSVIEIAADVQKETSAQRAHRNRVDYVTPWGAAESDPPGEPAVVYRARHVFCFPGVLEASLEGTIRHQYDSSQLTFQLFDQAEHAALQELVHKCRQFQCGSPLPCG